MNVYFHLCIIACSIIVYVVINKFICWTNLDTDPLLFAIGIVSARENFSLRDAIRSTWLKDYSRNKNDSIKSWFIVGKDDCKVPPQYRLSEYGCDKLNIKLADLSSHFYTSYKTNSNDGSSSSKEVFWQGFSFKVNHPLIVKKLGILYNLLIPNTEAKVAILDIQSKEIIVQAIISQNTSYLEKGYLYEDVETTLLPKHYEGMVLVEGYLQRDASDHILWNDGGGVITFNRQTYHHTAPAAAVLHQDAHWCRQTESLVHVQRISLHAGAIERTASCSIYSTPSHVDSIKYSNKIYPAASIYFVIHDFDDLKTLLAEEERITSQWLSNLENINRKLLIESNEMQDILFVDVKDTYRNLPNKLLQFYKWLNQNHKYSYVVKSDDDTVVDLEQLISRTKNSSRFKADELWLWSWFRTDWPVNYVGKWADFDYRSSLYPSFPCGATYIMSNKIVQWLSLNADYLFPYQGEDVSMGIWLSAVKPDFVNDPNFECDFTCSKNSYNRAQLKPEDIYEVWALYEKCQNLCSCN